MHVKAVKCTFHKSVVTEDLAIFPPKAATEAWVAFRRHIATWSILEGLPNQEEPQMSKLWVGLISALLGSSWRLSCQLMGRGSSHLWCWGKHRQSKIQLCLPLHLWRANFCYYAIISYCDSCLNFHLGHSFSDGMYSTNTQQILRDRRDLILTTVANSIALIKSCYSNLKWQGVNGKEHKHHPLHCSFRSWATCLYLKCSKKMDRLPKEFGLQLIKSQITCWEQMWVIHYSWARKDMK